MSACEPARVARPLAPRPSRRNSRAAFTLVEVLLVLALIALVSMVLLPAAGGLFPKAGGGGWDDTVATTFQKVRQQAVVSGREIALHFDPKTLRFAWPGGTSDPLGPAEQKLTVEFLRSSGGSSILIGGQLIETTTVPLLRFFPDGTCEPVRVQVRVAGGGQPRVLTIDPWTCAPGLEPKK